MKVQFARFEPHRKMAARDVALRVGQADTAVGVSPQHQFGLSFLEPAHGIEARTGDAKFERHGCLAPGQALTEKTTSGALSASRSQPKVICPWPTRWHSVRRNTTGSFWLPT